MTKVTTDHGSFKSIHWHAEMPFIQKPKIKCVKIIEGIKYYMGWTGKIYKAELFDKTFG